MFIENFYGQPLGAQIGVIAFGIAIVLLVISQTISIISYKAREKDTSLEELRRAVEKLTSARAVQNEENRRHGVIAHQTPRSVRRATRKTRKQTIGIECSRPVRRPNLRLGR